MAAIDFDAKQIYPECVTIKILSFIPALLVCVGVYTVCGALYMNICVVYVYSSYVHISQLYILYTHSRLKSQVSSKYGISSQPRLVDIIAAVPQEYKKVLQMAAQLCMLKVTCRLFFQN